MLKNTKSKILVFVVFLLLIAVVIGGHFIPIKSFVYQTDTLCRPNLLLDNGAVHKINKFKVISGGITEFNNLKTELTNQNITQQSKAGCEYSTQTIYLYLY